jgi:adenylate cyclase
LAVEIERKFLVRGTGWKSAAAVHIRQGYLNRDKSRTVRVRTAGERAYLTVKGASVRASRAEFEYEIPMADAQEMLALCDGPIIEKMRHVILHQGLRWEVDEFFGDNAGLIVAEIELERADQPVPLPDWIAEEVTEDPRYFNSNLATTPYKAWRGR